MHKSAYSTTETCLLLMAILQTIDATENKSQLADIWKSSKYKSVFTLHYILQTKNSS